MSFKYKNSSSIDQQTFADMDCWLSRPSDRTSPWLWVLSRKPDGSPDIMLMAMFGASYLNYQPYLNAEVATAAEVDIKWLAISGSTASDRPEPTTYTNAQNDENGSAQGSTASGIWVFRRPSSAQNIIKIMTYYSTIGFPLRGVEYEINTTPSNSMLIPTRTGIYESLSPGHDVGLGDLNSAFITLVRDMRGSDSIVTLIGFNDAGASELIFLKRKTTDNVWYKVGGFPCTPQELAVGWMPGGAFFLGDFGLFMVCGGGENPRAVATTPLDSINTTVVPSSGAYSFISTPDLSQQTLVKTSAVVGPTTGLVASSASMSQDMSTIFVVFLPQTPGDTMHGGKITFAITVHRKSSLVVASGGDLGSYHHIATFNMATTTTPLISGYPVIPTFVAWTPCCVTTGDGRAAFLTITTAQAIAAKLHAEDAGGANIVDKNLLWNRAVVVSFDSIPPKAQYIENVPTDSLRVRNTYISPSFTTADMSPTEANLEVAYVTGDTTYTSRNDGNYTLGGFGARSSTIYRTNDAHLGSNNDSWIPTWLWGVGGGSAPEAPTAPTMATTIELMTT